MRAKNAATTRVINAGDAIVVSVDYSAM